VALFGALTKLVSRKDNPAPKFSVQNLEIARGEALHTEAAITIEVVTPPKNGHVLTRWLEQINSGLRVAFGHPNSDFIIPQGDRHTIVLPLQDLAGHLGLENLGIDSKNVCCEFVNNRGRCDIIFALRGADGQPVAQSLTQQAKLLMKESIFFQHAEVIECRDGKVSILSFDIEKIVNSFIEIDQERYKGDFTKHLEKLCSGNFTEVTTPSQKRGDFVFAQRRVVSACHKVRDRLLSIAESARALCNAKVPSVLHALATPAVPTVLPAPIVTESAVPKPSGSPLVDLNSSLAPRRNNPTPPPTPRRSDSEQESLPKKQGWLKWLGSSVFGSTDLPQQGKVQPQNRVAEEEKLLEAELFAHEVHTAVAHGIMSAVDFGIRLALFPILTIRGIHPCPSPD
jgi:hypothetical protein